MSEKKRGFFDFHFRHNNARKHFGLITAKRNEHFKYLTLTHAEKRDKTHRNISLSHNPNPKDKRPAFLEKRERSDLQTNFRDPNKWKLSKADEKKVVEHLKKKKL